eukprot:TRINITY_DN2442_c0_g1_i1.p1 TRINITY_DN2442_c0_g1~~TRINITY_DN2442_c0_g1_i1.p1  ORF type:complete len:751 (+),score=95.42 TRINITY_DN2442_c0_g1_i1:75-2327(+)
MATARESKLLPHVQLHPVHRVQGPPFALRALQPSGSSRACRRWEVDELLQEVISSEMDIFDAQESPDAHNLRISLSNTGMAVSNADEKLLNIPLLLADVVEAALPETESQRSSYVVALAPRPEVGRQGLARGRSKSRATTLHPPLQDVWIFVVSGNSLDLKGLFCDLSVRGALRWDLQECYTINRKPLGEGGCGEIFLGQSLLAENFKGLQHKFEEPERRVRCTHQVAVKVLKQHATRTEEELMRKEIDFLARARGHPCITGLHGVFCAYDTYTGGEETESQQEAFAYDSKQGEGKLRFFIVMDLCSCGDLFDYLIGGPLDNKACVVLMKGLSEALRHLHSLEIVHRDVKPENILMGEHLRPILADFGIAASLHDKEEMAKVLGSPGYAAPELVSNLPYNERVDLFSAGVVYYYALTCHQPFHGKDRDDTLAKTTQCRVRYPQKWFQHVSTGILNVMKFCLSKDPKHRPSALRCSTALQQLASEILGEDSASDRLSLERSSVAQRQEADHQAEVVSPEPKRSSRSGRSLAAAGAGAEPSQAAGSLVRSRVLSRAGGGASSVAQPLDPPRSAELVSPAARPATQTAARPGAEVASPTAAVPANRDTAGLEVYPASSSALTPSRGEHREAMPVPPLSNSEQTPLTPQTPSGSATLLDSQKYASRLPEEPKFAGDTDGQQEMRGKSREETESTVKVTGPADPTERRKTARRPASVPSRVKQTLCSMPSTASRWISGVFLKSPRPAVEDPSARA